MSGKDVSPQIDILELHGIRLRLLNDLRPSSEFACWILAVECINSSGMIGLHMNFRPIRQISEKLKTSDDG